GVDPDVEVLRCQAALGAQPVHGAQGGDHVVPRVMLDDDPPGALFPRPDQGPAPVGAGVHSAHPGCLLADVQVHGEVPVHGHQDRGLAGLDHRVFPGDVQLPGRLGGDHEGPSPAGGTGSGTSSAPGPGPTIRTRSGPTISLSRVATAAASAGWLSTATFGPASAVA